MHSPNKYAVKEKCTSNASVRVAQESFVSFEFNLRIDCAMTSSSYGRVLCLESQKIDGTEYLRGSTDFAFFLYIIEPRRLKFGKRILK